MLIRVEKEGKVAYRFYESAHFNLAYWRGGTLSAEYPIAVELVIPRPRG